MPVFVYDVKGWAWHHKAKALVKEFGDDSSAISETDAALPIHRNFFCLDPERDVVFFSPEQFNRVRKSDAMSGLSDDFMRRHVFVGASFPSELPALARLVGKVTGVFVNNRRMRDTLVAVDIDAWLILNGVDYEFWHPAAEPRITPVDGPLRVGWVGNSRHHTHGGRAPHKGFSIVAEAAARAGAMLVAKDTVGDYSGDSYWTREQIRDRIYHQIDVLAVASEMEGTPNPALEAMACAVPVITTPVGDAAALIAKYGQGGWVVDRCVESFQLMFERLSRRTCVQMGKFGRERVTTHRTWRGAADQFRQMFRAAETRAMRGEDVNEKGESE